MAQRAPFALGIGTFALGIDPWRKKTRVMAQRAPFALGIGTFALGIPGHPQPGEKF